MAIFATTLVIMGLIIATIGEWIILVRAFRHDLLSFWVCATISFAGWAFAATDMEHPLVPLLLSVGGSGLVVVGIIICGEDLTCL